MKKNFIIIAILFFALNCYAGKDRSDLSFAAISQSMLKDANLIVRNSEIAYEIGNSIRMTEKSEVTVLNEAGMRDASISIYYTDFIKVNNLKITLFDKNGIYYKKIDDEQIVDVAPDIYYNLYDDLRLKYFSFSENRFPFTFVCEYKRELQNWTNIPSWAPLDKFNTSLESSKLKIEVPDGRKLYFKKYNLGDPLVEKMDGITTYQWGLREIKAIKKVSDVSPNEKIFPTLLLKTDCYRVGKQIGQFETWADVGNFYSVLNEGKTNFSPDISDQVRKNIFIDGTLKDKVKKAFQWVQSITHYVSIQNGIGGFVSYDANSVYKNKFGDCKALSGFMCAVLKSVGISSYPVLIKAGSDPELLPEDFPGNYFNHVILCVPDVNDTIWLECTSQKQPFNFLGSFTSDRIGLFIDAKNSFLIHTPIYDATSNSVYAFTKINLNSELIANCSSLVELKNECQDQSRQYQYNAKSDMMEHWLNKIIDQKDVKIKGHRFLSDQKDSAMTNLTMEFTSNSIATESGSRLFVYPSIIQLYSLDEIESGRSFDYFFGNSFTQFDSTIIQLPKGYHTETVVENDIIKKTDFGVFQQQVTFNKEQSQIVLSRKYSVCKSVISMDKSVEWNDYIKVIRRSLDTPIVFVKD